ncbi:MAG: THUMP domain-containing class I SAM-dependent RNA methyltransferase [Myxococcaceae bacterium]
MLGQETLLPAGVTTVEAACHFGAPFAYGGAMEELVFVSTTPGLEEALEGESRALAQAVSREAGGATLRGGRGLHQEANLRLRTASRVLLRIGQFPLGGSLDAKLSKVPLSKYSTGAVRVRAVGKGPLNALEAAATRVFHASGTAEGDAPEVQLRADAGGCTVSIDTSGELLYLRGYRQEVSRAPLRETLAAGVLLLAGYQGEEPLWDPMCGSGTIAIEGALIATHRAPGAMRSFGFERFPSHGGAAWKARLERARAEQRPAAHPIFASDLNAGSLGTARRNAKRAGVLDALTLERRDATRLEPPPGVAKGLVASNLPYGKRVGERSDLPKLYRAFGEALRRLEGWRYALLVAEGDEGALGLRPSRVIPVSNGGIRCGLLLGAL